MTGPLHLACRLAFSLEELLLEACHYQTGVTAELFSIIANCCGLLACLFLHFM
jgi:hypothetical protein